MEENDNRLIRSVFAIYPRDHVRPSFLAADECTDAYWSL